MKSNNNNRKTIVNTIKNMDVFLAPLVFWGACPLEYFSDWDYFMTLCRLITTSTHFISTNNSNNTSIIQYFTAFHRSYCLWRVHRIFEKTVFSRQFVGRNHKLKRIKSLSSKVFSIWKIYGRHEWGVVYYCLLSRTWYRIYY